MKNTLTSLYNYELLTEQDAYNALSQVASGSYTEAQVSGFISAYIMRRPTIAELKGFRSAMMDLCQPIELYPDDAVDIVGTGGDGKNSFNISTVSSIIVAATGCKVIKHGSYGASSVSGSSNVLECLGYHFLSDERALQQQLNDASICFLHAPLFHAAMKHVASARKNIGVRSFFNLLGPLINPAKPSKQVLGVNSLENARNYNYLLQQSSQQYTIIHSLDGYDEISLTGAFKIITRNSEQLFCPEDIGFDYVKPEEIEAGDTIQDAAEIFLSIIKGQGTKAQNDVVVINSAFAIQCVKPQQSLVECIAQARKALNNGDAYKIFRQITN